MREPIFADPDRFGGQTFDIASDAVSGKQLETLFSQAAGRPIPYARFSDEVLAASPFLAKLTALMDDGTLAGRADLKALRSLHPRMQSVREWLAHTGRDAFHQALGTTGTWAYDRR